ncbi:MAG TPA: NAD(P)-binding domain-containing protein, partial [Thermoanaerobaculia bacterium]|nr:NAD(P)-binding domain-containing protein [Thermoanaerobaculia bacterium]
MNESHQVAIVGAGPIGIELAIAMKQAGVDYVHIDAGQIGTTVEWYPIQMMFHSSSDRLSLAGVPIQTATQQKITREEYLAYLRSLVLQFDLDIRTYERVEEARRTPDGTFELRSRTIHGVANRYHVENVVLAIGAFHAPRTLDIPGEDLPHVSHYFRDPHVYFGRKLLIIGGRNSAVEAAVRCHRAGAEVTISYRQADFDPKVVKFWLLPEVRALIRDGLVRFLPNTVPVEIRARSVLLDPAGEIPADFGLMMTGYRQNTTLFDMLGVELQRIAREPVYDAETMETNVPGVFVAGTAIAGTPPRKVSVIVETCHVHVPRIVQAITGKQVEPV